MLIKYFSNFLFVEYVFLALTTFLQWLRKSICVMYLLYFVILMKAIITTKLVNDFFTFSMKIRVRKFT